MLPKSIKCREFGSGDTSDRDRTIPAFRRTLGHKRVRTAKSSTMKGGKLLTCKLCMVAQTAGFKRTCFAKRDLVSKRGFLLSTLRNLQSERVSHPS